MAFVNKLYSGINEIIRYDLILSKFKIVVTPELFSYRGGNIMKYMDYSTDVKYD